MAVLAKLCIYEKPTFPVCLSTVLNLGKSHKPNSSAGIRDFTHALRTSTHSALTASCAVNSLTLPCIVPYLENDKHKDGGSTNACLKFLLLFIMNGWTGQMKFGSEVNCKNFMQYMQNKTSFKLFKHEEIIIHSVFHICKIGLKLMDLDQFVFPD
jgi:hypothetical protein